MPVVHKGARILSMCHRGQNALQGRVRREGKTPLLTFIAIWFRPKSVIFLGFFQAKSRPGASSPGRPTGGRWPLLGVQDLHENTFYRDVKCNVMMMYGKQSENKWKVLLKSEILSIPPTCSFIHTVLCIDLCAMWSLHTWLDIDFSFKQDGKKSRRSILTSLTLIS
jgi:hypothetical protein